MKTTKIKIKNLFGISETELDGQSVEITGTNGAGKSDNKRRLGRLHCNVVQCGQSQTNEKLSQRCPLLHKQISVLDR